VPVRAEQLFRPNDDDAEEFAKEYESVVREQCGQALPKNQK